MVYIEKEKTKDEIEKIEDEFDLTLADEAYNEYIKDGKKSRPIEQLWEELDLWGMQAKNLWLVINTKSPLCI